MKNDVSQFGRTCDACQRRKSENMPYPCLLQPTPVLTQAWSHLTMDFIEQLPLSMGFDTRLVVVDRLTKFSHFIALTHPFTTKQVARLFIDNIYRLHDLPETLGIWCLLADSGRN